MAKIILDRDGVVNFDSEEYIKTPDEWRPIPGSLTAIANLNNNGFDVFIATNQSGIARGLYDEIMLHAIHEKFISELAKYGGKICDIFFCPHHPDFGCECRKPKPGLLHQIQQKHELDLSQTFFIGDSYVDVQAAMAAGCLPILVLTGKGAYSLKCFPEFKNYIPIFENLDAAVLYVIEHEKKNHNG